MKNIPDLKNKIALIVDDNEMNQLVISKILQREGLTTFSTYNGEYAIQKLQEGLKPDIILMDLDMPVMNGLKACELIRNKMKIDVPIIINSGSVSAYEKYKLNLLGITDYLIKPYTIADILDKLSKNILACNSVIL